MKQYLPTFGERAMDVWGKTDQRDQTMVLAGSISAPASGMVTSLASKTIAHVFHAHAGIEQNGPIHPGKVCGIILAAGFSTRMRGQFKPLLTLPMPSPDLVTDPGIGRISGLASARSFSQTNEIQALELVIRCQRAAGIQPLVVCGYRHEDSSALARRCGAMIAINPDPEKGMFSSLLAGLSALPPACSHFLVQPVDIPLIRQMTFHILLDQANRNMARENGPTVIIPTWQGKPGHPPLIPTRFVPAIQTFQGNGGLAGVLASLPCSEVAVPDKYILDDMDTPEAWQIMRQAAASSDTLDPDEALEILHLRGLPEQTIAHCQAVGLVAEAMARELDKKTYPSLEPKLALAGGLAHDLCKGMRHHEEAAGRFFRQHGLGRMAWLVESHRDLSLPPDQPITERELVYLADKLVSGKRPVPIDERFGEKMQKFEKHPDIQAEIGGRMERAKALARRFAEESGQDPLELAQKTLAPNAWAKNVLPKK